MNPPAPHLNVFQQLIIQWERLHPYNAAQAMRLTFAPSIEQLTSAWRAALTMLGLGTVWHHDGKVIHDFSPGVIAASVIRPIDSEDHLNDYLSGQLNLAFEQGELPYRPFSCTTSSGAIVGVVYHHWVCDSFCIRSLLREWLYHLVSPDRVTRTPLLPAGHGYWHHFGPGAAGWPVLPALLQQLSQSGRLRHCRRVHVGRANESNAAFAQVRAPAGLVAAVRHVSRRRGVKVNDLFLVALAKTARDLAPLEPPHHRHDLALGSIVDLRNLPGRSPADAFGMFLGFTNTILRGEVMGDTEKLLAAVAAQSRLARERRLAQAGQIRMSFGLLAGAIFDDRNLREFYRKRLPLAGGISNITLHNSWAAEAHPNYISEYLRVSPTGPFMPLVLTPTTLGDALHLGITTRINGAGAPTGASIGRRFLHELENLT